MGYITLTKDGEIKLSKLPYMLKYLVKYLIDGINSLINGDCDEDRVASTIGTLKQNAEGKINNSDTVSYDKAGDMLGFGATNRVGLKKLLDKNGIKQVVINNQKCGFLRADIAALCDKVNKDIRNRNIKRYNGLKRHNKTNI